MNQIDLVTVTVGPGLEPALWTGINFAKELASKYKKPLIGANHLEGHLYSFLLLQKTGIMIHDSRIKNLFPAVALIVSGGHTILLRVESFSKWRRLGETRDDAVGEAFDKVARLLNLPYPGGPEIEKLAKIGNPSAIAFPRPMLHEKNYDFSFSGLKTAVLYYLKENLNAKKTDIAACFQQAAIDVLIAKTMRAAEAYGARSIILGGGVAANAALKKTLGLTAKKAGCAFFAPGKTYYGDNAAMIGAAGYMAHLQKKKCPLKADGTLDI
jgi:N6-L-threonylcarbamoyladenine synthase